MRFELDLQIQIACRTSARARTALSCQSDFLPFDHTGRNGHFQGARFDGDVALLVELRCLEFDRMARAAKSIFEIDLDLGRVIFAGRSESAAESARAALPAEGAARAEELREEIAEARVLASAELRREFEIPAPVGRWCERLPLAP